MEVTSKKIEAKFKFSKQWIDVTDKTQEATVDLVIDYQNNTFSVTPANNSTGRFTFCKGGKNSAIMWNAVLDLVKKAISFAKEELGLHE